MSDFTQLPHLNSVAPQHEVPWLCLPEWSVIGRGLLLLVSWIVVLLIGLSLWSQYEFFTAHGSRCGNGGPPSFEVIGLFVGVNLGIWMFFANVHKKCIWLTKLPALVSLILWLGIGIKVGVELPIPDLQNAQRNHQ